MGAPRIRSVGFDGALWELVAPRVEAALGRLGLADRLPAVCIAADDLPGDDEAWYRLVPGREGRELVLSCHSLAFCRPVPASSTEYPPRAVWEQFDAPREDEMPAPAEYHAERADAFLYHHLLTVQDLLDGTVIAEDIPPRLAEAFGAAWAVTVDGRLARADLPGYGMAHRRGRFSRLFSSAGIMLPDHWQIFQSLWEGGLSGRRDVLAVARQLPRLTPGGRGGAGRIG